MLLCSGKKSLEHGRADAQPPVVAQDGDGELIFRGGEIVAEIGGSRVFARSLDGVKEIKQLSDKD